MVDAAELAELAQLGMFAMDASGALLYANRRFGALLGAADPAELLGDGWFDRVHADDLPQVLELRRRGPADRRPYMCLYRAAGTSARHGG